MRADDIRCAPRVPDTYRTESMYMPGRTTFAEMSPKQLRLGLCQKSKGNWQVCKACPGGCTAGRMLVMRMEETGKQEQAPEKPAEKPEPETGLEDGRAIYLVERKETALRRYVEMMRLVAEGVSPEEAADRMGYKQKKSVLNFRRRHEAECKAWLAAADVPDIDIRRRAR